MPVRVFTFLFAMGFILPSAFAAKKPPQPPAISSDFGSVVELSPFEVTAQSVEFNHWIKISSPHFVIYTDTSTKEATVLLKQMEMVHKAAQFFLRRKSLNLPPLLIVLPTGRSDWRKIASRGGVEWKVATSLVGSSRKLLLVQYDWQSDGLGSVWAMIGVQEVAAMNLNGPLWFRQGLAGFFRTVTFSPDTLTIGKQGFDGYFIHKYGWMNWSKFFSITTRSPEFIKDSNEHDQFEGQCTVFVHYLLTNSDPVWTARLLGWATYLNANNEPTEETFKQIFQQDWKGWQEQLDKMLNGGTYTSGNIRFPPAALEFPIATSNLPAREMRELFVLSQILNQQTKDSYASLDALLQRGLKTESLHELFADACECRNHSDAGLTELRGIITGGSANPAVYSQAASALFHRSVTKPSAESRLGEETEEIRACCNKALEFEPLHVEANETLAWTEAFAPTVEKHNLEVIARVCRALDGNAPTDAALAALAVARWRTGSLKQARSLCERLDSSPLSRKQVKILAKELLALLDRPPLPSAPESATATATSPSGLKPESAASASH